MISRLLSMFRYIFPVAAIQIDGKTVAAYTGSNSSVEGMYRDYNRILELYPHLEDRLTIDRINI